MSPFKGQGANQALLDACELADAIVSAAGGADDGGDGGDGSDRLTEALAAYHEAMVRRVSRHVLGSRRNVEFSHSEAAGQLPALLRHFGVSSAEKEKAMRQRVRGVNEALFPTTAPAKAGAAAADALPSRRQLSSFECPACGSELRAKLPHGTKGLTMVRCECGEVFAVQAPQGPCE